LERLNSSEQQAEFSDTDVDEETDGDDLLDEHESVQSTMPFFENEKQLLEELIAQGASCMRTDRKGEALVEIAREIVLEQRQKLLIFTEYRATQSYLLVKLEKLLGRKPVLINGSQTVDEKRDAVTQFEGDADVLISTEAGGEGLNLHRKCHVMVNFDLPWNPARITQRIGRLYRYGQAERVVVINFHARDTIDNEIVSTVMDRLETIVRQMASVGPEFDERYAAEVMGELLERIDISQLLDDARLGRIERTDERVEAALNEARRAKTIQDEVLSSIDSYDISKWQELGALTTAHLARFVRRTAPLLGIGVEDVRGEESFTLRLPAEVRGLFPEFGSKTVVQVTTKRGHNRATELVLLDFSNGFLRHLVRSALSEVFGGTYAAFASKLIEAELFGVFLARFQNDQGQPLGERLVVIEQGLDGTDGTNQSQVVKQLFQETLESAEANQADPAARRTKFDTLKDRAELIMAEDTNRFLHPNDLVCIAVAERGRPIVDRVPRPVEK
jgi:hypothetical protein